LNPSRDADCISGEENEPGSCGKELDLVRWCGRVTDVWD
jgi:hypothetical protein